jgi:hypothetical protein
MKIRKAIWGIPILVSFLFSGCELEQTALNIDSISGKATLKGRVMYKSGEVQNGLYVNEIWSPATGQTVYAYLDNDDLTGNPAAAGKTCYTAIVNDSGYYTLTLPATVAGVTVTLEFSNFEGSYKVFDGLDNNGVMQYKNVVGYYVATPSVTNISNGMSYIEDNSTYAFTARPELTVGELETTDYVKVSGQITYSAENRSADSLSISTIKKAAIGKKILVTYDNIVYSATSESKTIGEETLAIYEVLLPTTSNSAQLVNISLDPVSYEGTSTHYIKTGSSIKYNSIVVWEGKYAHDNAYGSSIWVTLEKGFTTFIPTAVNFTFTKYPDYAQ